MKMKKIILVGDGMGDYPVPSLGNQTPLQAAKAPFMRTLAGTGSVCMVQTIPEGMQPGSDVANLCLMGYNPADHYTGRAPIEAAGAGIPLREQDVALRCNLVTVEDGIMVDYSAGHISSDEAAELMAACRRKLERPGLSFHDGISYRHLVVWEDGPNDAITHPPHDIADQKINSYLPSGSRCDEIRQLMEDSREVLLEHPVNKARVKAGKKPANQCWLWGQGKSMTLPSYQELYKLTGGVISAVDLVRGLGRLAGLQPVIVPGATGFLGTNYQGKVAAAMKILEDRDFVYLHVEAPDECGHMGDCQKKVQAIEEFDSNIVGPVWNALEAWGIPYRILLCTDHRTPVSVKGHTPEPVPMAWVDGPCGHRGQAAPFDEFIDGGNARERADAAIRKLLR